MVTESHRDAKQSMETASSCLCALLELIQGYPTTPRLLWLALLRSEVLTTVADTKQSHKLSGLVSCAENGKVLQGSIKPSGFQAVYHLFWGMMGKSTSIDFVRCACSLSSFSIPAVDHSRNSCVL